MRQIAIPVESINHFCIENQIRRLSPFGSVLGDTFRSDSDIDVIKEFMPGKRVGMLAIPRIERELSKIFGGRKIALRTPADLSRYFRDEVLQNAELFYDA